MIGIFVLILLAYYIGNKARAHHLNVARWRMRLIFAWIFGELFVGLLSLFLTKNLQVASLSGLLGATLGALLIFQAMSNEITSADDEEQKD